MDKDLFEQLIAPNIVPATADINNEAQGAETLMKALIKSEDLGQGPRQLDLHGLKTATVDNKNFYCIIHILRWAPGVDGKQTVQAQKWYLYN